MFGSRCVGISSAVIKPTVKSGKAGELINITTAQRIHMNEHMHVSE